MESKDVLLLACIIVTLICIWLFLKVKAERKKWRTIADENYRLIADNALLEAEQLKFQLQPHTLNNILANLKSIANKLNKGMDSLSQTLDYILYKGKSHLVSVSDEINFIKKYLALNDLFISEIDSIKFNDSLVEQYSKYYSTLCVPHLISVYFIENAFKHGDIQHPEFLNIHLRLTGNTFEMNVKNRISQKPIKKNGGLGLGNMRKRLDLLTGGKYTYSIKTDYTDQEYYATLIIKFL